MRLIQHKKEAYWFYRFVSLAYDRYINPFFWNEPMRAQALALARLDRPDLQVVDVGAGSGFATEGIVQQVAPQSVTMLDQSPHQLANAAKKPALADCPKYEGDAEDLPFATDRFDRYVSTGSIEYWPEPQRAIAEAYRVLKPGGIALLVGPLQRQNPIARWLADTWMLFPSREEYYRWYERAGLRDIQLTYVAPEWYDEGSNPFAIAIAGVKPQAGESPLELGPKAEQPDEPMTPQRWAAFAYRFVVGSLAGAAFVPIAIVRTALAKLRGNARRS